MLLHSRLLFFTTETGILSFLKLSTTCRPTPNNHRPRGHGRCQRSDGSSSYLRDLFQISKPHKAECGRGDGRRHPVCFEQIIEGKTRISQSEDDNECRRDTETEKTRSWTFRALGRRIYSDAVIPYYKWLALMVLSKPKPPTFKMPILSPIFLSHRGCVMRMYPKWRNVQTIFFESPRFFIGRARACLTCSDWSRIRCLSDCK